MDLAVEPALCDARLSTQVVFADPDLSGLLKELGCPSQLTGGGVGDSRVVASEDLSAWVVHLTELGNFILPKARQSCT